MAPATILYFLLTVLTRLLQLSEPLPAAGAGTHCLVHEFIINPKPLPGQQQCKVQSQLDQRIFLSYDCVGAMAISPDVHAGKLNSTKSWNDLFKTLQDLITEIKKLWWDIKPEECASTVARMTCCQKADGNILGFWEFGCNGKFFLRFHSNNKTWEDLLSGFSSMKEKLKNVELSELLYRTSLVDCGSWLKEFLEHSEENLETTAPPTTLAATLPTSKATRLSHRALLLILPCSLILLNVV
ncbi:UL16-binding protein 1-like [Cavia porcellus]|uniref:MHC class I-like antigen recognition-like domain-containing protein n=1 Tax=Cavia porcellus TaxID=10141 RepID=A0A286XKZ8_CAVPO|nr:UL16-binding protein 1-like [Cavia porcellus]